VHQDEIKDRSKKKVRDKEWRRVVIKHNLIEEIAKWIKY
jgi:hypothetical protein